MSDKATISAIIPEKTKSKIAYIDNLKVLLMVLVILHHTVITYGGPGNWYYMQRTTLKGAVIPMTWFVATNQAFFMGFFFFLSALFVPSSYDKKGAAKFIKDRVIRLGLPLLFYTFILGPCMNYLVYYYGYNHHIPFMQYLGGYDDWIDFGVLWFVVALLLFTLLYALWRNVFNSQPKTDRPAPSTGKIILFSAALGVVSYVVRIVFPIGWVLPLAGFQLGHFPQYIVMFIFGLIAARNNWLSAITYRQGKVMAIIGVCIVLLVFPVFYILLSWLKFPSSYFSGNGQWPSLLYALWEQMSGLAIMVALIGIGKQLLNKTSAFQSKLSRSAFAVYIFHPLVVICVALALKDWAIEPALKLLVACPLAVSLSFLLGSILVVIPGVKKII